MMFWAVFWPDNKDPILCSIRFTREDAIDHALDYMDCKTWKKLYRHGFRCCKLIAEKKP